DSCCADRVPIIYVKYIVQTAIVPAVDFVFFTHIFFNHENFSTNRHSVGKDPACSELAGDYWSSLFFH
ncbi:hypothetical protein, partial [Oenococcus oeni]